MIRIPNPYAAGAVLLAVLAVFAFGWNRGADKWKGRYNDEVAAHKATRAQHKAVLDDLATKARAAADKAKQASEQAKADRKTNDQRYEDARDEADRAKRDLAAALRRGTTRLQDHWACGVPGAAEGGAPAAAGRQDAGARLRQESAVRIVGAGDEADRWIAWLQAELTSTRKTCAP